MEPERAGDAQGTCDGQFLEQGLEGHKKCAEAAQGTCDGRFSEQGMDPKEEMLVGEVLVEETGGGKLVRRFSAGSLPKDPARRFAELFAARPRWHMADLQPFLKGIQVTPQLPLRANSWFLSSPSSRALRAHSWFLSSPSSRAFSLFLTCP